MLWCVVLLYCLKIDGISEIQLALPFSKNDFFKKLRIVLITLSAIEGHLSGNLEKCFVFFTFRKFSKILFCHSLPQSLFNLTGDRFDNVINFENLFVIV